MESPAKPGFLSDSSPRALRNLKAVSKHWARELSVSIWSKEPSSGLESSYQRCSQRNDGTSRYASSRVRASLSSAAFAARVANCVYLFADRRRCGCALCIGNPWAPPLGNRIVGRARIVGVDGRFKCALPGEVAGRHGARPASKLQVECGQSRACCSRSGAAIIRRRSQSAGRPHPRTRGEPGHSATSAGPRAESHSSIGARRYPPRLNSDLGALCGAGRADRGPVPDTGHPIRCKRATVQCWTAEEGAEDESPCEPSSQRARE